MSLPKYVINFDELTEQLKKDLLGLIKKELEEKYPDLDFTNVEALLKDIEDLLPDKEYRKLKKKIKQFTQYKVEGQHQNEGRLLYIPPVKKDIREIFKFDYDVLVTGLHINMTGWKKEDKFELILNQKKIISDANIKEIGEHKYFNVFYPVTKNKPISFIFHNNSGNSRQLTIDLDFIKGDFSEIEPPTPPEPTEPVEPVKPNENLDIIVPTGGINKIGYIDVDNDINELIIEGNFSNVTGEQWPDLILIYSENKDEIGDTFGYSCTYCNSKYEIKQENLPACKSVEYTGWGYPVEKYIIKKPKKGRWYMEAIAFGSLADSEVTIKTNMNWILTNIQIK